MARTREQTRQDAPPPSVQDFDFDLARAVSEQLIEALDALPASPLTDDAVSRLDSRQGVYQLFYDGQPVYVGKADKSLRGRLRRHYRSLSARGNLDVTKLGFKALYIHRNWTTWTSEDVLLRHYTGSVWNNSGYGSNDPGRNRDDTDIGAGDFHQRYPIRVDWVVNEIQAGQYECNALLLALKKSLPYLFRYEIEHKNRLRRGSPKYNGREINIERDGMTAEELIASIARQLGPTWQATKFPSRIILYEENRAYVHGTIFAGDEAPT